MLPNRFLNSGFTFSEHETNLKFKYRVLNSMLLIAAFFSLLFGLLHDLELNDIGAIHAKVDYLYSATCITLIILLRGRRAFFTKAATIFSIASLICFVSALIFVTNDEFRLIWFYLLIYAAYVLLGARAGMVMTIAVVASIIICAGLFDLHLSQTAIFTATIGFIIASLLNRTYTIQMSSNVEQLDSALIKAQQASKAKSLFLANISHEIRTPLNGMLGMAQVMQGTQLDDEQRHYLETFEHSGKTLKFLIDELLDLSKIESGTLILDLKSFDSFRWVMDIQMVTEPLFEASNVSFSTEVSDDLPPQLLGDSTRLMQIIINLVSNAAKFTHKGEVKLTIGGEASSAGRFHLHISVEDSGIGIPENQLNDIFSRFHQLSDNSIINKGVGLGLAICERLVSAMNGKLDVRSVENEGSCFWFNIELPIATEHNSTLVAIQHTESTRLFNVLLVDDDAINRLAASMLLKQAGHHVDMATDGVDAIKQLKATAYDIVLMDIHMPIMDGVEATKIIRSDPPVKNSQIPIIGVTASVMKDECERYLNIGMDAVVEKPIVAEKLIQTMYDTIKRRESMIDSYTQAP